MLSEMVLDASRYPTIVFESTGSPRKGGPRSLDLSVRGRMTIHGMTKTVTTPFRSNSPAIG